MYHTNRAGGWVALALLLSLCTPAPEAVAGENTALHARNTTVLDVPDDAELFAAYQATARTKRCRAGGNTGAGSRPSTKVI